ncbi:hypothetical protein [Roseofilum capinflatum]|uniref:Uncharacterized protein n=1 Tax=Roseofilum capinflatum BLCC-M114 TaxID=3022440 RepID=A0ABT7B576_9CYAN|nr:hypothetical protein [Roseofilum capinflatum]MDJ1173408.1 hypothetical protein [Roseofilum capinflatum BLCC-M114]
MTPQTDQRQALITEIDSVLSKTQSRLPWVMAGEVSQQRRVLRRVREYLAQLPTSPTPGPSRQGQLPPSTRPTPPSRRRMSLLGADLSQQSQPAPETSANQQIVQAVVQDLRTSILMPLQAEIADLQNQREQMRQELQSLDQQRRNNAMSGQSQKMMTEFFQTLIDRCAESLTQQVAQNLADLQVELLQYRPREPHDPILAPDSNADPSLLTPQERLDQLRALQSQSDKLLKTLDASINVVFETLQSNLQSYSESMTEGIEHMYSLGQQGEVMFNALVNRLASQLGREASSYMQTRPEDSTGGALENTSGGRSLNPSEIEDRVDRVEQKDPTPPPLSDALDSPPVAQPRDSEDRMESVDLAEEIEEPEEEEQLDSQEADEFLDEEITSEFFEQFEELEEAVEITEVEEETKDQFSGESLSDESMQGDELYDALFGSDRFTTGEIPQPGESDDPLQELTEETPEEAIAQETEADTQPDEEAIAETVESDLFEGLADEETSEEAIASTEGEEVPPEPEEISSTDSVVESNLFEGAPPPSQVEDPVSLETFMELFGEEDAPTSISSESLETNGEGSALESTEDVYIPASPDEVLLPTDTEEPEELSQLNLQGEVLEQLSQDLFSLEGDEPPVPSPAPEERAEDMFESLEPVSSALDEPEEPPQTPEEQEDIFGNLEPVSSALDEPEEPPQTPEEQEDIFGNLEPVSSTLDEPEEGANPKTENFLDEILDAPEPSPPRPEPLEDGGSSEPGGTVDSLFEGFSEAAESSELSASPAIASEEAAPENPVDWPESLTIDTVFEQEPGTVEAEEPTSITLDNVFEEETSGEQNQIDPSRQKGTSTIENMFDGFLQGETSDLDLDQPSPPSSQTNPPPSEDSFTVDDVFEGFGEDDPDPPLNSLNKN